MDRIVRGKFRDMIYSRHCRRLLIRLRQCFLKCSRLGVYGMLQGVCKLSLECKFSNTGKYIWKQQTGLRYVWLLRIQGRSIELSARVQPSMNACRVNKHQEVGLGATLPLPQVFYKSCNHGLNIFLSFSKSGHKLNFDMTNENTITMKSRCWMSSNKVLAECIPLLPHYPSDVLFGTVTPLDFPMPLNTNP